MNKKILSLIIILLIVVVAIFVFLKPQEPEDVTRGFYDDWISYNGDPLADEIYTQDDRVTREFVESISAAKESSTQDRYDPVLCGETQPSSFSTFVINKNRDSAVVRTLMIIGESSVRADVDLKVVEGDWKIENIRCVSRDEDAGDEESMFEEEGNLVKRNGNWTLVYEEPGRPALSIDLRFDEDSSCREGGIETLCLSGILEEGARVNVVGLKVLDLEANGTSTEALEVKNLEVVRFESMEGVVIRAEESQGIITILIGGGVEAIRSDISRAEIVSNFGESLEIDDIELADQVRINGSFIGNIFMAERVDIIKASPKESSGNSESNGGN